MTHNTAETIQFVAIMLAITISVGIISKCAYEVRAIEKTQCFKDDAKE